MIFTNQDIHCPRFTADCEAARAKLGGVALVRDLYEQRYWSNEYRLRHAESTCWKQTQGKWQPINVSYRKRCRHGISYRKEGEWERCYLSHPIGQRGPRSLLNGVLGEAVSGATVTDQLVVSGQIG